MEKGKVVVVSGYFNPLHVGHLEMIEQAKALGDYLIVVINSDEQVKMKGSVPFMPQDDRKRIIEALKAVDEVFISIDKDKSVCESLRYLKPDIFANGGDRHQGEVPESVICREFDIKMVDGLGNKIRSSSTIIKEAKKHKDIRDNK